MDPTTQMLEAAAEGDLTQVQRLLALDPALARAAGGHAKSALHSASERNQPAVAEALLAAGADLEAETSWGMTALEWAANMGRREVADVLIRHGARVNLWAAAGLGLLERVRSFWIGPRALAAGAAQAHHRQAPDGRWVKTEAPTDYVEIISDACYVAARNGHIHVVDFLLREGADVNYRGFFGGTGLHWAAINGHREAVAYLLAHGADPALRDLTHDATSVMWADEGGHADIADLIRRQGGAAG